MLKKIPLLKVLSLISFFSFFTISNVIAQEKTPSQEEIVYSNPDIYPTFEGGMDKFFKFFSKNYRIPNRYKGIGNLGITFIVEKDGSISDIKVIKDLGNGTAAEAIRVMKLSPKWIPGKYDGKPVRTLFYMPAKIGHN